MWHDGDLDEMRKRRPVCKRNASSGDKALNDKRPTRVFTWSCDCSVGRCLKDAGTNRRC